jgi:YebC/PmpR family DNA-binding regulatory protein
MGRKFEVRKASMAKTNLQKTKLYSRFGKEIYMAAKQGGPSPDANMTLKRIIEKAKAEQVPSDIIKRNIDKASSSVGEDYQAVRYEGFGPGGSTVLVDAMTDNVNRTVSEVRNCFTKSAGKLGVNGSVEHSYEHLSHVIVQGLSADAVLDYLLEKDIEVIDIEEEATGILITAKGYDLDAVVEAVSSQSDLTITLQESGWFALEEISLEAEHKGLFEKLLTMLDNVEDVSNVYHNVAEDAS